MSSVLDTLGASLAIERATSGRSAELDALDHIEPADYVVGMIGETFVIQFPDGHWITDPTAVREFARSVMQCPTPRRRTAMYDTFSPYEIQSADEAAALLERHDPTASACVQRIGANAKTLVQARKVGQMWAALARVSRLATVTLDVDPEEFGKPVSLRPGVPQLQLFSLPEWHHLNKDGEDDLVAVVYYVPVTTWVTKPEMVLDPITGRPTYTEPKVLASQTDPGGFLAVTEVMHMTLTQVDEWTQDLRNAVRALAIGDAEFEADTEADDLTRAEQMAEEMRRLSAL